MNIFMKGKSKRIGFYVMLCILVFFGAGGISVQAAETVDPSNLDEETLSYFYDYSPNFFIPEGGEEAIETIHVTLTEELKTALENGTDINVTTEEGVSYLQSRLTQFLREPRKTSIYLPSSSRMCIRLIMCLTAEPMIQPIRQHTPMVRAWYHLAAHPKKDVHLRDGMAMRLTVML